MSDHIDAEFVEHSHALAIDHAAPPSLMSSMRPVDKVALGTEIADAVKDVLVKRNLISHIQGKEYVQLEGWQTAAALSGVSARVEWTKPLENGNGWECRAVAVRVDNGVVVGAGEGMCSREERSWKSRDDYALRAMAQTRASSRALRGVLAWIMVLAGYSPTPAEEMPREESSHVAPRLMSAETAAEIVARSKALGMDADAFAAMVQRVVGTPGIGRKHGTTVEQGEAILRHLAGLQAASKPADDVPAVEPVQSAPQAEEAPDPAPSEPNKAPGATRAQRIHLAKLQKVLQYDDESYRAVLESLTGVRSTTMMHPAQAAEVIAWMEGEARHLGLAVERHPALDAVAS